MQWPEYCWRPGRWLAWLAGAAPIGVSSPLTRTGREAGCCRSCRVNGTASGGGTAAAAGGRRGRYVTCCCCGRRTALTRLELGATVAAMAAFSRAASGRVSLRGETAGKTGWRRSTELDTASVLLLLLLAPLASAGGCPSCAAAVASSAAAGSAEKVDGWVEGTKKGRL
eukprot:SAG22_NODE_335_length_12071_cov_5.268771_11_plen_169_part_00